MTVYVDNAIGLIYNVRICSLFADTDEELHSMINKIGVERRWYRNTTMYDYHYDIELNKRALAIAIGAVKVTVRQRAMMMQNRRLTGVLGAPDPYYGAGYKKRLVESASKR